MQAMFSGRRRIAPKIAVFFFLLIAPTTLLCAEESAFQGRIGEGRVFGNLRIDPDANSVEGWYYTIDSPDQRILIGTTDETDHIELREKNDDETDRRRWRLVIADDWSISGTAGMDEVVLAVVAVTARYAWSGLNGAHVGFDYPTFLSRREYREATETAEQAARATFESWVAEIRSEQDSLRNPFTYEIESWYTFQYIDERIISVLHSTYSYLGGAHGMVYFGSMLFLQREGVFRPVRLQDIFRAESGWEKALSELLMDELHGLGASAVVYGEITEFTVRELAVYTLSTQGITFHFAPYTVGAYVEGVFTPVISWDEIEPYLSAEIRDWRRSVDLW